MVKVYYGFMVSKSTSLKHFVEVGGIMEECGILNLVYLFI